MIKHLVAEQFNSIALSLQKKFIAECFERWNDVQIDKDYQLDVYSETLGYFLAVFYSPEGLQEFIKYHPFLKCTIVNDGSNCTGVFYCDSDYIITFNHAHLMLVQ